MSRSRRFLRNPIKFLRNGIRNRIVGRRVAFQKNIGFPSGRLDPQLAAQARKRAPARETQAFDGKLALLASLAMSGEKESFRKVWVHAFGDLVSKNERVRLLGLRAEFEIAAGDHDQLMKTVERLLVEHTEPLGHFYKAQSLIAKGAYREAIQALLLFLLKRPGHADGVYLLCEAAERMGDKELAWRALERLARVSKRNKTWLMMAHLVENDADLFRLLGNWNDWKTGGLGSEGNKDVKEFIALGALRAGNIELAKEIWRDSLLSAVLGGKGFAAMQVRKPSYSSGRAEIALSDINRVLTEKGIEMFLVSGTLLGCIREGKLLGHDKDIDVGIWSSVAPEAVYDAVTGSGLFFILRSRSKDIIRLRHVNGVAVDVFYHFRDENDYWHRGVKMIWHNTPFVLTPREFLGETFLIPADFELYLKENYGDWRTPKLIFDSAFDTPNGEPADDAEMTVHSFKGLMDACIVGKSDKMEFYLAHLDRFGEEAFTQAFRAAVAEKRGLV